MLIPDLPLCVDLDGTLIYEDTTRLLLKDCLIKRPLFMIAVLKEWIFKGRPSAKRLLANNFSLPPVTYTPLLQLLHEEKKRGRTLILATGTDKIIADTIASSLDIFDHVIATDLGENLVAQKKADSIVHYLKGKKFIYAGNSWADVPVWDASMQALLVNTPPRLRKAMEKDFSLQQKSYIVFS